VCTSVLNILMMINYLRGVGGFRKWSWGDQDQEMSPSKRVTYTGTLQAIVRF
jgi:hypothetical protein